MTENSLIHSTLARTMLACVHEYELIKSKRSPRFRTVGEFCRHHGFSRQNFLKIYWRWQQDPRELSLLPRKRGPKYKTRRPDLALDGEIRELREAGNNRHEIHAILKAWHKELAPSPSSIYNYLRKHGLNRLSRPQRKERRDIIMSKAGELLHIDCHHLPDGITIAPCGSLYLVGVIDGFTRLAWAEITESVKALEVMFAALRAFNMLRLRYGIEAEAVLSDNGSEFGAGPAAKNKQEHPCERLLLEMNIAHRYTKPYRPQTNGKIERFWRTLGEDFLEGACYNDKSDLQQELLEYLLYYNEHRPHQSLDNKTPKEFLNCKRII
jgi:transposase InsO family protein